MLNKESIIDTIVKCSNFYNKHIYNKVNNKRLNGKNHKLYSIAENILLNKISKCIKIAKAQEPDFTLMYNLGEIMKLHQSTNKFNDWSNYDIPTIKMYLPKCIVSGDFYRYIELSSISINNIITQNNLDKNNLNDVETAVRNTNIIDISGIASCTTSKSYVDNSTINSGKLYSKRVDSNGNKIDTPCRLIITLSEGIDVTVFWDELKKNAYDNNQQEFLKDFGECMGQLVQNEKEIIGPMSSNYKIYNLEEIQTYL